MNHKRVYSLCVSYETLAWYSEILPIICVCLVKLWLTIIILPLDKL